MEESNGADDNNSGKTVDPKLGITSVFCDAGIVEEPKQETPVVSSFFPVTNVSSTTNVNNNNVNSNSANANTNSKAAKPAGSKVSAMSVNGKSTIMMVPPELMKLEYYHGLLPREDTVHLLKNIGEFLVRVSQPTKSDCDRQIIISVVISKERDHDKNVRHFVVKRETNGKYYLGNSPKFDSVVGLLQHFIAEQTVLTDVPNAVLRTPMCRQYWEIRHADVEINDKKPLGSGQFGDVCKGKWKKRVDRTIDVAIKQGKSTVLTKRKIKDMMQEARIMRNFCHPNVVKIYGVAVDEDPIMIIMELVRGGSLDDYFKKHVGRISESEKLNNMVAGAAFGLEYLHYKRCIHRDIASRNTLYDRHKVLKISDFGLSRLGEKYKMTATRRVPIKWISPEVLINYTYTKASDVFSFGVMIWEIYTDGGDPFEGKKTPEIKKMLLEGYRLPFPEKTPIAIKNMVENCMWLAQPDKRDIMHVIVAKISAISGVHPPKKNRVTDKTLNQKPSDKEVDQDKNGGYGQSPAAESNSMKRGASQRGKPPASNQKTASYSSGASLIANNPESPAKGQQ